MSLPQGASLAQGEYERIQQAVEALANDDPSKSGIHAPRSLSVQVNLHVHNEFPKMVYKGKKSLVVNNQAEQENAVERGYSLDAPAPVHEDAE